MVRRVDLFALLNGLISVYKPPNLNLDKFLSLVKRQLADEFNALPAEPKCFRSVLRPSINNASNGVTIVSVPDIVDDKLVLGKTFFPGDFVVHPVDPLDDISSGIQVLGIGEDGVYAHSTEFARGCWLKSYHLSGMLGRASTDGTALGSTLLRTSWQHVTRTKFDRVLAGMLAQFRRAALLHAGLRPNTQNAYLALARRTSGFDLRPVAPGAVDTELDDLEQILSPWERNPPKDQRMSLVNPIGELPRSDEAERRQKAPYVNSLSCIKFDPPFFTLELQVAHETSQFLIDLVANIGPKVRSTTLLSSARRVRHGRLTLEHALLLKQCTVPPAVLQSLSNYILREIDSSITADFDEETEVLSLLRRLSGPDPVRNPHIFSNLYTCCKLHPLTPSEYPLKEQRFLTAVAPSKS